MIERDYFDVKLQAKLLLVIGSGGIEGSYRIVAGDTIFSDEGGDVGVGVAIEEAIVTDTEANDYVEIGVCLVEQAGLKDGVAHGGTYLLALGGDADGGLGFAGYLANDGVGLKTIGTKDAGKGAGFVYEADAIGYAYLVSANLAGKLHDFLYACPLTIAFVLYLGTGYHDVVVATFVVSLDGPLEIFITQVNGGAKLRIGTVLELAILCATIDTTMEGFGVHIIIGFNVQDSIF